MNTNGLSGIVISRTVLIISDQTRIRKRDRIPLTANPPKGAPSWFLLRPIRLAKVAAESIVHENELRSAVIMQKVCDYLYVRTLQGPGRGQSFTPNTDILGRLARKSWSAYAVGDWTGLAELKW